MDPRAAVAVGALAIAGRADCRLRAATALAAAAVAVVEAGRAAGRMRLR